MFAQIRRHVSANFVAYIALFVALGGTAYAAATIGSSEIVNNSIRSVDIRDNAVESRDIKNRTLKAVDFAPGVLLKGDAGPVGAAGPAGPKGDKGDRGVIVGNATQVPNANNLTCGTPTVVGSLPVTVTEPTRIWVQAHANMRVNGTSANDFGMWFQLRNNLGVVVSISGTQWDSNFVGVDDPMSFAPGGLLLNATDPELAPPIAGPFTAPVGSYTLDLVALAGGTCPSSTPGFGVNQGAVMSYLLVGAA